MQKNVQMSVQIKRKYSTTYNSAPYIRHIKFSVFLFLLIKNKLFYRYCIVKKQKSKYIISRRKFNKFSENNFRNFADRKKGRYRKYGLNYQIHYWHFASLIWIHSCFIFVFISVLISVLIYFFISIRFHFISFFYFISYRRWR